MLKSSGNRCVASGLATDITSDAPLGILTGPLGNLSLTACDTGISCETGLGNTKSNVLAVTWRLHGTDHHYNVDQLAYSFFLASPLQRVELDVKPNTRTETHLGRLKMRMMLSARNALAAH